MHTGELLNNKAWRNIYDVLSDALTNKEKYMHAFLSDPASAEKGIGEFAEIKDAAGLGDISAKTSIVDCYIKIMDSDLFDDINTLLGTAVNFEDIQKNNIYILYEMLLFDGNFSYWLKKYGDTHEFNDVHLLTAISEKEKNGEFRNLFSAQRSKKRFIANIVYAMAYGQDCIESLQYQDINEIGILNRNYIYIVYCGRKIRLPFLSFENDGVILNIQKKTVQNSAVNFDRQNPIVITAKNNSNRISVAGYDVTPGENVHYYNERIFNLKCISLEDMRDKFRTINSVIYDLLIMNQKGKGSFLVTGSDMGVGKSTFLLSMLEKCPDGWGIGILDPQNEMQVSIKYPNKNVITLVENAQKDLSECFSYLLKTSRDIIVISEITMPREVSELVNAALRLNAGVCATLHSFSPQEVIPNLRNLMLRTDMYHDRRTAENDIAGSIDLIIDLKRLPTGRIVVDSIYEVDNGSRNYQIPEILPEWSKEELELFSLKIQTILQRESLVGSRYLLKKLIQYTPDSDEWDILGCPSDRYFCKMGRYASEGILSSVKTAFGQQGR